MESGFESRIRIRPCRSLRQEVSHTSVRGGGVNTPNFRTTFPRLQGERRERGEGEGGRNGRGEEKGRDPQGLVDTPMFQILKNTLVCAVSVLLVLL